MSRVSLRDFCDKIRGTAVKKSHYASKESSWTKKFLLFENSLKKRDESWKHTTAHNFSRICSTLKKLWNINGTQHIRNFIYIIFYLVFKLFFSFSLEKWQTWTRECRREKKNFQVRMMMEEEESPNRWKSLLDKSEEKT